MNNKIMIAHQAKCFYSTYQLLADTDRKSDPVMYIIPRLVNGMFAAELALKALLAYEEIPYKNEHNLINLYYLLPDDLFAEIGCRFHTLCPCYSKEEYMKGFITVSEAFVNARYSFEKPYATFDLGFCDGIIQAIVETLLARHDIRETLLLLAACSRNLRSQ